MRGVILSPPSATLPFPGLLGRGLLLTSLSAPTGLRSPAASLLASLRLRVAGLGGQAGGLLRRGLAFAEKLSPSEALRPDLGDLDDLLLARDFADDLSPVDRASELPVVLLTVVPVVLLRTNLIF